ncbi:type IV secretion system DNA-binding domain-containing protein [Ochrobactrum daejeonense]|nr:type IV secretion system DNA-binding domain-containing protein [Brucella daejeonensis]
MIGSVVERGDKAIIFDEKGDYTRITPPSVRDGKEVPPLLLAPQDDRSAVWDIAADLIVSQDAVELAQRIIPDDGHPFYAERSRCPRRLRYQADGGKTEGMDMARSAQ